MSRKAVRNTLLLVTIVAEAVLFLFAFGVARSSGGSSRDDLQWVLMAFVVQMPMLAVGALACVAARPWPTRLALIIGFVLLGIDAALIVVELGGPGDVTWLTALLALPAVTVLGGVWLVGRARVERNVLRARMERSQSEPSPRVTGFHIEPSKGKVEPLVSERAVVSPPVAWRVDAPIDRPAEEALPRGGKYGNRAAGATAVRSSDECSECVRGRIRGASYCLHCGRRITPGL